MRKIALDADPGVADALTLAFALFDPNVEIVAATSVGGSVDSQTSARNLQSLVAFLDPPRLPRVGIEEKRSVDSKTQNGDKYKKIKSNDFPAEASFFNNFNGFTLPGVERLSPRPAATILRDAVRSHPRETSILALGPLTNVARAFRRDPELPFLLHRLVVAGGGVPSNVRNAAEFNVWADQQAARAVFQAPCAKTYVPFDAASELVFSFDDLRALALKGSGVGDFLRRSLLGILRARRQNNGEEVFYFQELAAYFALVEPSLCSTVDAVSVDEICGAPLDVSRWSQDARAFASRRPDVEIVREIDVDAVRRKIVAGFQRISEITSSRLPR